MKARTWVSWLVGFAAAWILAGLVQAARADCLGHSKWELEIVSGEELGWPSDGLLKNSAGGSVDGLWFWGDTADSTVVVFMEPE